ncbi:MAG: hypothetical protein ACYSW6_11125 [Planctomycetota bacterium]
MSDDKTEAVDKVADVVKIIIRGWPIYGVVVAMMWGYGELWLNKKITDAIAEQTLVQPAIVGLTGAVQVNTNAVQRIETKVEVVEEDTKEILKIMAGE